MDKPFQGSKILDVGCGDGRHLAFFKIIGMEPYQMGFKIFESAIVQFVAKGTQ